MRDEPKGSDLRTASTEEMSDAMQEGVRSALQDHKRAGRSVVVWDWENQRVSTVPPDQIEIPAEASPQPSGPAEIESIAPPRSDPPAPAPQHP